MTQPSSSSAMDVTQLLRPNIRRLVPYRCARDDYQEGILLDANENTHGVAVHDLAGHEHALELNRYPDPHQIKVKQLLCDFRGGNLKPENIYLGVGSDEVVDSLIRAVCAPGREKILTCPPTYGMYHVSADINDVELVPVNLDFDTFDLRTDAILETLHADPLIKLVYVCSPGNPTAKQVSKDSILRLLNEWEGGIVAVDEAYVDFSEGSLAPLVLEHPRLVVLQTMSKSFGLAGLRLGACFACEPLATLFNAMKAPYNISSTTSALAERALQPNSIALMRQHVASIIAERARLTAELPKIAGVDRIIGGLDANFLLVRIKGGNTRALRVYEQLAQHRQIVIRFRGKEPGCEGCVRISIGTPSENDAVLKHLQEVLEDIQ